MKQIRVLKPSEISCRVQQVTDGGGAIILLYKDARTDMTILDETFGAENWQRAHREIDGKMFCVISVWDADKNAWVSKEDVGVESNTEATKGEASDAFKRAGTNWGIGRELYTSPFIYVQLDADEMRTGNNGKKQTTARFGLSVSNIAYNEDREIKYLVLVDKKGRVRFTHGRPPTASAATTAASSAERKQQLKIDRMTVISKDVQRYIGSRAKKDIREGIEAANVSMTVNGQYDGTPYEDMTAEAFAEYLKNLNDYYKHTKEEAQSA